MSAGANGPSGRRSHPAASPVGDAVQAMGRRALPADADRGVQARSGRDGRRRLDARRLDVDGQSQPYTNNVIWAGLATGAGLPATVAPIGRTESGLPIGVQIIGPYLEDSTPIQFAQLLEQAFGGLRAGRCLKQA